MLPFPISVGRAHPSVGAADLQSALNPCTESAGSFSLISMIFLSSSL